jgi:Domain of unknown function (DUF1906)
MPIQMLRNFLAGLVLLPAICAAQAHGPYLGFDKNLYPGDDLLPALHKTFAFTGYWLNDPPGMTSNPWAGKRPQLRAAGFGFLILFNGRLDAQLKSANAAELGTADAAAAAEAARREGFPSHAILFLDQEEGGRLLPEQAAYLSAWFAGVAKAGFRPGIYCSGIDVPEGSGTISTSKDIAARFPEVKLWIVNDQCPPAPGCVAHALDLVKSGVEHALVENALVWQFARSPRSEFASACGQGYASDQNCYAPGLPHSEKNFVDLNASASPDPSGGR